MRMEGFTLKLTGPVRERIQGHLDDITDYDAVAAIAWWEGGSDYIPQPDGREKVIEVGPHWGIGFYDRAKMRPEDLVVIEGITFVVEEGQTKQRLNGKTVDLHEGRVVVR